MPEPQNGKEAAPPPPQNKILWTSTLPFGDIYWDLELHIAPQAAEKNNMGFSRDLSRILIHMTLRFEVTHLLYKVNYRCIEIPDPN